MVIQSKSIVIREIRPYTGTHGGLSPAIHRDEPHPVRRRYQYPNTCGSHCAIVQLDNRYSPAKRALSLVRKYIYTLLRLVELQYCYFILLFIFENFGARAGSRGSRFGPTFFKHRWRWARTSTNAEIPAAQLSLCTSEVLASRDGSGSTFLVPYMILSTRGNYSRSNGRGTDPVHLSTLCSTGPTRAPVRPHAQPIIPSASLRKRSNECESEKQLVKCQRLGIALTEIRCSWDLGGSCIATSTASGRTTALPSGNSCAEFPLSS